MKQIINYELDIKRFLRKEEKLESKREKNQRIFEREATKFFRLRKGE